LQTSLFLRNRGSHARSWWNERLTRLWPRRRR
jgi:hypothetical protein